MSELTDALREHGQQHAGSTLGGVLQWAALHIESQDEALAELREAYAEEEAERLRLETALFESKSSIEQALAAVSGKVRTEIDISRDYTGHINLMGGMGDPDYMKGGNSCRHIDLRETKPRRQKGKPS